MSQPARQWVSVQEYLAFEQDALNKHEYFDGEIFAMAGARPAHNVIAGNVLGELRTQLEDGPCLVYNSDQRVMIADTGLYTYPDVMVVCDEPQFDETDEIALVNPIVIVEVLSDSTEAYDRGDKFAHYRRLPSLREYLLVSSDRERIERFSRNDGTREWALAESSDPHGMLEVPAIGCVLALPRVYLKVVIPPPAPGKRRGPL